VWRIFAIQWAVFFSSSPKANLVRYFFRANICPNILAQEVLKEHSCCIELVWVKERSSIGRVVVARIRGALADTKGGKIQSSCFFYMVSTAIKGAPRAPARRLWSRDEVCLLLARKNNGEKRNSAMLSNRSTGRRFVRHRRLFPRTASGRSPAHAVEHCSLRAAWKYAYLFHAPVRLTRHVE